MKNEKRQALFFFLFEKFWKSCNVRKQNSRGWILGDALFFSRVLTFTLPFFLLSPGYYTTLWFPFCSISTRRLCEWHAQNWRSETSASFFAIRVSVTLWTYNEHRETLWIVASFHSTPSPPLQTICTDPRICRSNFNNYSVWDRKSQFRTRVVTRRGCEDLRRFTVFGVCMCVHETWLRSLKIDFPFFSVIKCELAGVLFFVPKVTKLRDWGIVTVSLTLIDAAKLFTIGNTLISLGPCLWNSRLIITILARSSVNRPVFRSHQNIQRLGTDREQLRIVQRHPGSALRFVEQSHFPGLRSGRVQKKDWRKVRREHGPVDGECRNKRAGTWLHWCFFVLHIGDVAGFER